MTTVRTEPHPFGYYAPTPLVQRILRATRATSHSWAGKRRAIFLRAAAMKQLGNRPVDVEAMGARLRVRPQHNVCEKRILFTPHYFDEPERTFLTGHLAPGCTFIDIGANIGGYALHVAAALGAGAHIIAVEPLDCLFERLVVNIKLNAFATIKALDCAIADKDGEVTLFVDDRNEGDSSIRLFNRGHAGDMRQVPALSLMSLIARERVTRIDALKIDVEGAEDIILEPFFAQAAPDLHPRLLLVPDLTRVWPTDLIGLIEHHNYRVALRTRSNLAFEKM
ncbi:MAG: FkbM family methyltransferase [Hyphomicrobiales bacterium]|nr:FkbM family methyltransferase [Hyphomicrobiales bacterium]